jgi:hypothetical protein
MHRWKMRTSRAFGAGVLGAVVAATLLSHGTAYAAGSEAPNHVREVALSGITSTSGAGTEIVVHGTEAPVFAVRVEGGGKKLVVDLSNADVAGAKPAMTDSVGVVGGVLTQAFRTEAGQLTRVTVNLVKTAAYRVFADGNDLKIQLAPASATAPAAPSLFGGRAEVEAARGPELSDVRFERKRATAGAHASTSTSRKDADIHNVLRLLEADVGTRVNIVTTPTANIVDGSVTIRMRNVPGTRRSSGAPGQGPRHGAQGNMIRVAPLADLNKSASSPRRRKRSCSSRRSRRA